MSQIIQTSSGPAILTDEGRVILPTDQFGIGKLIKDEPAIVTTLVQTLKANVDQADPEIAKVVDLVPLTDEESGVLFMANTSFSNIVSIAGAVHDYPRTEK